MRVAQKAEKNRGKGKISLTHAFCFCCLCIAVTPKLFATALKGKQKSKNNIKN